MKKEKIKKKNKKGLPGFVVVAMVSSPEEKIEVDRVVRNAFFGLKFRLIGRLAYSQRMAEKIIKEVFKDGKHKS